MSLILDALRKSEAERQRGKSPDLFASTPGLPMPLRERLRLWPVLVFLLLLLASAWVIWRGDARRAQNDADTLVAAATRPDSGAAVIDPPDRTRHDATTGGPPPARSSAVPVVSRSASLPPANQAQASAALAAPVVASQPAPPAALPALPPPPAANDLPAEAALPTVAVLDAGTRASLPALKLSMHVYGDDPAKRFAIVDGKRVGAGSLLGSGVVEEIRRDGVVVNVNGQRVLLPKP